MRNVNPYLTAELACVTSVLGNFSDLYLLSQGGTITGTILTYNAYFLCSFTHGDGLDGDARRARSFSSVNMFASKKLGELCCAASLPSLKEKGLWATDSQAPEELPQ